MGHKVLELTAFIEPDGKYFTALCLELNISSFGDTPQEAFDALQDAVNEYLVYALETGQEDLLNRPVPRPVMNKYRAIIRRSERRMPKPTEKRPFTVKLPKVSPLAAAAAMHG